MRKGSKQTEEAKEKNRQKHIGNIPWNKGKKIGNLYPNSGQFKKGEISWHKGKTGVYSKETIEKFRQSHVGKLTKEKNPRWKGGITSENHKIRSSFEYNCWRRAVFERDKYTCIWCGQIGGKLQADHIKPFALFPELRLAIDNGRTLCKKCHLTTETWGNRKNICK